jgi:phosphate transport system substrate-binding protein
MTYRIPRFHRPTPVSVVAPSSTLQMPVTGAGATFPALLYQKWAQEYRNAGGAPVNYQPVGSSGGIKAVIAKSVDFGASDSPMSDDELKAASAILHLPMCIGAVVPAYSVPGAPDGLKFTGELLADFALGKVTRWNDRAIAALNPGVRLPALPIVPAFRSDGSGTTAIYTHYLCQASAEFRAKVGEGKSVRWPVGIGAKGNDGVAASVRSTPGGFGYVEQAYAEKNKIAFGAVRNRSGQFVKATLQSASEAARSAKLPADFRAMVTDTSDREGYPIAGFTWILVPAGAKPEVRKFLRWCLVEGQKSAATHDYAPLPESVRARALAALDRWK